MRLWSVALREAGARRQEWRGLREDSDGGERQCGWRPARGESTRWRGAGPRARSRASKDGGTAWAGGGASPAPQSPSISSLLRVFLGNDTVPPDAFPTSIELCVEFPPVVCSYGELYLLGF